MLDQTSQQPHLAALPPVSSVCAESPSLQICWTSPYPTPPAGRSPSCRLQNQIGSRPIRRRCPPDTGRQRRLFFAKRKPLAELVERKSLRLWTKIKLLVKVKLGLPTNKTRNKEDLIVDKDISSLEHTRWRCQYHVVFAPKYRRLAIYGELKQDIGYILRKLCERKGIEIIEAEACPDHIHMLISIPPKLSVSQVMGYLKGKSSLMIFDRHANLKYKYGNRHFWARGYYVDTVGRNKKAIQEYIQNQLKEDELADQLSIKEYFDPFTGEKVDQGRKGQKGSFTSSKRK